MRKAVDMCYSDEERGTNAYFVHLGSWKAGLEKQDEINSRITCIQNTRTIEYDDELKRSDVAIYEKQNSHPGKLSTPNLIDLRY